MVAEPRSDNASSSTANPNHDRRDKKIGPHYRLGTMIGKGGFGCVYKALDQQRGHFVAIKQVGLGSLASGVSTVDLGAIEMEIILLSKLRHRNIVKYIDSIRTESYFNIILEYVEGGSLASILKRFGAFPEALCAIYTFQILKGLQYLHGQGVIHRDIKGANVLLTKTGLVKLADFGVAMKLTEVDSSKRRVVGTPYWMAPEVIEMMQPTPACDIWSVGSTVVEMITEKPPYSDLQQVTALYRIVSDPHPPVPEGVTQPLESFLLLCFSKESTRRPSARELLGDEWIVSNKRQTLEFTKSMLSSSAAASADQNMASPRGSQDDEGLEEDVDDDVNQLSMFVQTINQREEALQQKKKDVQNDPSPRASPHDESVPLDETLPIESNVVSADRGQSLDGAPMEDLQNQYHFAFLDYYNKHVVGDEKKSKSQARSQSLDIAVEEPKANDDSQAETREAASPSARTGSDEVPVIMDAEAAGGPDFRKNRYNGDDPAQLDALASHGRDWKREAAEMKQLLGSIRPFEQPQVLVRICKRLMELLQQSSAKDNEAIYEQLVTQHGAVPIVEMLHVTDEGLLRTVLKVVNQIIEGNQKFQEIFAMVGLIPVVIKFAKPHYSRPLRYEAACFVSLLCHTSVRSLQMLVAGGGLEALVDLVSHEYYHNRDLVWRGLDALTKVFKSAPETSSQKRDFCRILAKRGICWHLCALIDTLAADIYHKSAEYLKVVVDLLTSFAREGDAVVKVYMARGVVLEGLVASLEYLPPDLQVQICKVFKNLAQEPAVLNMLENAGIVPVLVHMLSCHVIPGRRISDATAASQEACSQSLLALFFLSKLSRPRQEQAALAGVAPLLRELCTQRHQLRVYAFSMLCDMTQASLATRRILWALDGAAFLVGSLASHDFQTFALEALASWLSVREHRADWCARVEGVLMRNDEFLTKLVVLFRVPQVAIFMKILDPLLKLVRVSDRINRAIAAHQDFFLELVRRLKIAHHFRGTSLEVEAAPDGVAYVVLPEPVLEEEVQVLQDRQMGVDAALAPLGAPRTATPVKRMVSEPAVLASDDVRARTHLLRLLLMLCQAQTTLQREVTCEQYRLQPLLRHVLQQERRRGRVILIEIASQLLELFGEVADDR